MSKGSRGINSGGDPGCVIALLILLVIAALFLCSPIINAFVDALGKTAP